MKQLLLALGFLLLTACSAPEVSDLAVENPTLTIPPFETAILVTPTTLPSPQPTLSVVPLDSSEIIDEIPLDTITSFEQMPGNRATGQPAADFTARLLGGGTFVLSEEQGKYWLVLPTAIGCGDCSYILYLLSQAQPQNPTSLNVLVLNIYQPDLPEYWQSYADAINQPNYLWAVLDTPTFMEDYDIYGLGTFLVVDPDGRLVFQTDSPPPPELIRHLYTLASNEEQK
jgi:hypothetical protein